ncbi:MAG TPA: alpha/beta hydrolase, partial [Polyangiaceae bacterium]
RSALPFFLAALLALGCSSKEGPRAAPSAASPPPSAAPPSPPPVPATPSEEVTFDTEDKVPLAGTLHLVTDGAAPLLVLVHRYRGDRSEWAPVAARLASSEKRYSILAFDLRGHGASRTGPEKKRLDWADMKPKDMPTFVTDVHAAIKYGLSRSPSGKADRVVIVGSSLGAAFAARAASQDARVIAVGLISPGAAIEGYDAYHPFADVRMLPTFLAGAKEDNVSKEPIDGMSRMAKELATVKSYDGKGHGIFGLYAEGDQVTKDLEQWLMGVFEAQPVSRELLPREGESGKKKPHKGPVP